MSKDDIITAAVLVIGDEILSGRTKDRNIGAIAEHLTAIGIALREVRIVGDVAEEIVAAVNALRARYTYLFTTGGIGPTHDDITAACVAKAFDLPLVQDQEAFAILEKHYGIENLTPPRAKMALVPEGAKLIPNPVSAAPGFVIGNVHVMAGVPRIMQAMMVHVMADIKAGKPILSNTVACNLPESKVAQDLAVLQEKYPDVDIGSYPHYRGGALGLSLVLRGTNNENLDLATAEVLQIIKKHGDEPRALSIRSSGRGISAEGL